MFLKPHTFLDTKHSRAKTPEPDHFSPPFWIEPWMKHCHSLTPRGLPVSSSRENTLLLGSIFRCVAFVSVAFV